jgi:TMEM175 potassium channel family protein
MSKHTSSPARLEAFSDGVIAVIITIMVLELKVPQQGGLAGLRAVLPTLAVYLLSFTLTGIYWINHHHLVHRTREADQRILYANLGFLFCLSLIPFFTSYLLDKKIDSFSVALYCTSMIVTGTSFLLLRLSISRRLRLAGELDQEDVATQRKHWMSLGLYLIAGPLAFYHPYLALGVVAMVTVVWIVPTARVEPSEEEQLRHL